MIQLASKLTTSFASENKSWTLNSWTVKGDKIGTIYLEGQLSVIDFGTLEFIEFRSYLDLDL